MRAKYKTFWGIMLTAVAVMAVGLWWWMTRPQQPASADAVQAAEGAPAWVEQQEKIFLAHLSDSLQAAYDSLTMPVQRARFWERNGALPLAGYYYYQAAADQPDTVWLRRAGEYLFEAGPLLDDSTAVGWAAQAAMDAFDRLLKVRPGDLNSRARMGALLVESGTDVMKGIGYLREVLDADPDHPLALLYLGVLSIRSGQYQKARERFLHLLNLQPQNPMVHYYLAHIYQVLDSPQQTVLHLEAWKADVQDPQLRLQIDSLIQQLKK